MVILSLINISSSKDYELVSAKESESLIIKDIQKKMCELMNELLYFATSFYFYVVTKMTSAANDDFVRTQVW